MKKRIIISIFFICQFLLLSAQKSDIELADEYFYEQEYQKAIPHYENYLANIDSFFGFKKLISCYIKTKNYSKAESSIFRILNNSMATVYDYMKYAKFFMNIKNYEKAISILERYNGNENEKIELLNLLLSCKQLANLTDEHRFIARKIKYNSDQDDIISSYYKNGLIIASSRNSSTTGNSFSFYHSKINEQGDLESPTLFSNNINTKQNEAWCCFSTNSKFIYFTRYKGEGKITDKQSYRTYVARNNGTDWDKPEIMQFSTMGYSVGQPFISADGRWMFVVSDKEGGFGGTDIYMSHKQGFMWGPLVNLGPNINTAGNEMFPYFAPDGYLYFSSDGHIGLGGMDIFKSAYIQQTWSFPVNIGPPFNSPADDFSFIVREDNTKGFFSSDRSGNVDIYTYGHNIAKVKPISGRVINAKGKQALDSVKVILLDNLSQENITYTDKDGNFKFELFNDKEYSFVIEKKGYRSKRVEYKHRKGKKKNKFFKIMLAQAKWKKLKGEILNGRNQKPLRNVDIQIINKTYKTDIVGKSKPLGDFTFDIDPDLEYDIVVSQRGYLSKVIYNYKYEKNKKLTIFMEPFFGQKEMSLSQINFTTNSAELNDATCFGLKPLIDILKVNAHLDVDLDMAYQASCSKKIARPLRIRRLAEIKEYLESRGIAADRIKYKENPTTKDVMGMRVKLYTKK
ncbi:MAG: carboxypeptidase-like regulatory domain-containing protein [Marinifilaceae bacterium]|jgi:tetratricopeptide (TPR) repeat protein|nr:carboxypeptidase-like regulatory domain-containing protein [Marinifilaceae bacterium]